MIAATGKILQITRAKDWRLSFVPFIIGCVYFWLWWFQISLNISSLLLFVLSFITTFGFAALGYFINEFFDKAVDAKAGKINKLAFLPVAYQFLIFLGCVVATSLPWLWLPSDRATVVLFGVEIGLFLMYSLPFPRLKQVPLISSFIDSGYAYLVPLLLSVHTYSLYANSNHKPMIVVLATTVFFIGFRNITIHHVNDIFKDMRSHTVTLPQIIGANATNYLVMILLLEEILFVFEWTILIALQQPLFWLWFLIFSLALVLRYRFVAKDLRLQFISIEPVRHLTDPIYQSIFPVFTLFLAISFDYTWLLLVPFHFALLITPPIRKKAIEITVSKTITSLYATKSLLKKLFWVPVAAMVNYSIFFMFLLVGVNLREENTDAISFIKRKLNRE